MYIYQTVYIGLLFVSKRSFSEKLIYNSLLLKWGILYLIFIVSYKPFKREQNFAFVMLG